MKSIGVQALVYSTILFLMGLSIPIALYPSRTDSWPLFLSSIPIPIYCGVRIWMTFKNAPPYPKIQFNLFDPFIFRMVLLLSSGLIILFSGCFGYREILYKFSAVMLPIVFFPYLYLIGQIRISWVELCLHPFILTSLGIFMAILVPQDYFGRHQVDLSELYPAAIILGLCAIWIIGVIAQAIVVTKNAKKAEVQGFEVILPNPIKPQEPPHDADPGK